MESILVNAQAVEAWVRDAYGLEVEATPLPGERDANYALRTAGGRRYVAKVMHEGVDRALVDLQIQMLRHLEATAPAVPVPRVVPTKEGCAMTRGVGEGRWLWVQTYLGGRLMAHARPQTPSLRASLGRELGHLDAALAQFEHDAARRRHRWDLAHTAWVRDALDVHRDPARRALVDRMLARYEEHAQPVLPALRRSIIHGDANDYNVLVESRLDGTQAVVGLVDVGDAVETQTVNEVAIAAAYALMGQPDPLAAIADVVAGYHDAYPLTEVEVAIVFPLVVARLCVSVTIAAERVRETPNDPYVTISEAPAWEGLKRLAEVPSRFAAYALRHACGWTAMPNGARIRAAIDERAAIAHPVLGEPLDARAPLVLDLSTSSLLLGADPRNTEPDALDARIRAEMTRHGADVAIGRYDEPRLLYHSPSFSAGAHPTAERRTIHLGVDLFAEAGTPIHAPVAGTVELVACNDAAYDFGPLLILRHALDDGTPLFTLYGHLGPEVLDAWQPGDAVAAGQHIATIGPRPINGDWAPHLHFQLLLDLVDLGRHVPGVALPRYRAVWTELCPSPYALLGVPADTIPPTLPSDEALAARRGILFGPNLSLSYRRPLHIVRGWKQFLYDAEGQAYLDAYNNVPHVGHSHPRVVEAVQQQIALLNTNTRYLSALRQQYAERLTALLPEPLTVVYLVNSGSEANELALRLARAHTERRGMIVMDAAYHGHSTTLIDISPYKYDGPGGEGAPDWVTQVPQPDLYRGPYGADDPEAATRYAAHVADAAGRLAARGWPAGAFIAETMPSVGGQLVLPDGYLSAAYTHVRAAGGVCIADEVQVGFGRLGEARWGFETYSVSPDIVVLGKPMGNGFPLAAVVTTRAIAASFDTGMEFFSTFGGNPVACAAGLAVLDVLEDEALQAHARVVGDRLLDGLRTLQTTYPMLGDVRGKGLFLGAEIVRDPGTREPAAAEARYVVDRLRDHAILTGTDGPHHNVLKIRPPMPFSLADADLLLDCLDAILREDPLRG